MSNESNAQGKDNVDSKRPSRKRGTAFPVVPLSDAARIIKVAGESGFEHATASFATYMGHSTINSGAFRQRLAAFRDWELISGRGDMLALTEVAKRIAMSTDEAEECQALQQAFKNCDVFDGLHQKMAKGQPLGRERLGAVAVLDFGVAPSKKPAFVKSFVESAVAARLAEIDDQDKVVLLESDNDGLADDSGLSSDEPTVVEPAESRQAVMPRSAQDRAVGSLSPTIRQSWLITGGEIILEVRSEEALPATVFGAIGEVVTKLEALAASLSQRDDSDATGEGGET